MGEEIRKARAERMMLNEECLAKVSVWVHKLAGFLTKEQVPVFIGGPALLLLAADVAGVTRGTPLGKALAKVIKEHLGIVLEESTKQ